MELNGQQVGQKVPGARIRFQSLDYSIYTNGSALQRFSNFCDCLMMGGVHPQAGLTDNSSKQRANRQFYFVHHFTFLIQPAVVDRPRRLLRNIH